MKPYRITYRAGIYRLWRIRGGLAFNVAAAFTIAELFSYHPLTHAGRNIGPGISLKTLRAI